MIPQNDIHAVDAAIEEANDRAVEAHFGGDGNERDHGDYCGCAYCNPGPEEYDFDR